MISFLDYYNETLNKIVGIIENRHHKYVFIRGNSNSGKTTILKDLYNMITGGKVFLTGSKPLNHSINAARAKNSLLEYANERREIVVVADEFFDEYMNYFVNEDEFKITFVIGIKNVPKNICGKCFIYDLDDINEFLKKAVKEMFHFTSPYIEGLSNMQLIEIYNSLCANKTLDIMDSAKYPFKDYENNKKKQECNSFKIISSYTSYTIVEMIIHKI